MALEQEKSSKAAYTLALKIAVLDLKNASPPWSWNDIKEALEKEPWRFKLEQPLIVSRDTIKLWGRQEKKIRETFSSQLREGMAPEAIASLKKCRALEYPELDCHLFRWFQFAQSVNMSASTPILVMKAKALVEQFRKSDELKDHYLNYDPDVNFVERFRQRHGMIWRKKHGEKANQDAPAAAQWIEQNIKPLLQQYAPKDIFNMDETGFFYKAMPDRTFVIAGKPISGIKMDKSRLVCVNM